MRPRGSPQEERKKVFRRMEWAFVWAPPILAVVVAILGSTFLAWFVPIPDTTFWGRWVIAILVIGVLPAVIYAAKSYLERDG